MESVKDFDEVLICDMESTDHTLDIAKEFCCKIVTFQRKDYKSAKPARTFAIQSASYSWILVVDADELVTPELKDYLYELILNTNCPEGLFIPRQNRFMNIPYSHAIRKTMVSVPCYGVLSGGSSSLTF